MADGFVLGPLVPVPSLKKKREAEMPILTRLTQPSLSRQKSSAVVLTQTVCQMMTYHDTLSFPWDHPYI